MRREGGTVYVSAADAATLAAIAAEHGLDTASIRRALELDDDSPADHQLLTPCVATFYRLSLDFLSGSGWGS